MQDEQDVQCLADRRIAFVLVFSDLEHHRQEVGGEVEIIVGVDVRHADRVPVAGSSQRWQLGDQASDLQLAVLGIFDVLRLGVERSERRDARHEHAHRVSVVLEAVDEVAAEVLVHVRVVRDVVLPLVVLGLVW